MLESLICKKLLAVSDIHIKTPEDKDYKKLLALVASVNPQETTHFILLGDIFDFCCGTKSYFKKKYSSFF